MTDTRSANSLETYLDLIGPHFTRRSCYTCSSQPFFWLNEIFNVLSPAKQANRVQFGFKKFKKRLLAVFRTKMEKVLVKNQLRLKRILMNGKQRKPRWRSLRWKHLYVARVFDQRLFAQFMYVRLGHHLVPRDKWIAPFIKEYNLLWIRRSALNALCLVWKFSADPLCWGG